MRPEIGEVIVALSKVLGMDCSAASVVIRDTIRAAEIEALEWAANLADLKQHHRIIANTIRVQIEFRKKD